MPLRTLVADVLLNIPQLSTIDDLHNNPTRTPALLEQVTEATQKADAGPGRHAGQEPVRPNRRYPRTGVFAQGIGEVEPYRPGCATVDRGLH